jgi:para-aminobenzoate synthetase component I
MAAALTETSVSIRALSWQDPFAMALALRHHPFLVFLDSAMGGEWSYLAVSPHRRFQVREGVAYVDGAPSRAEALEELRRLLRPARSGTARRKTKEAPPFQGGAIGFVSYEAARLFENLELRRYPEPWPQMDFAIVETFFAFHIPSQQAFIVSCSREAEHDSDALLNTLRKAKCNPRPSLLWHSRDSRSQYEAKIERIREQILDGEIFQANLSSGFTAKAEVDPFALYDSLRRNNPAPYAALWVEGERFIASASPESFLSIRGKTVSTRPIKGTIKRGDTQEDDKILAETLLASEKDRAENTMIVDLLRNDLSRIAEAPSVVVRKLCALESFPHIHHLVSTVTAQKRDTMDALDVLGACFPGGSITGAPKIRAMEIIDDLEQEPRGVYCGALGWIGFEGDAEFSIPIRTLTGINQDLSLRAGGGITLLSDAAAEFTEMQVKAHSVLSCCTL